MLRNVELRDSYESGRDSLLDDFYVPCLQESIKYDRAVGYFSSTLYHVVAFAFSDFIQRGGRMRLICSPALSLTDFDAIQNGFLAREEAQNQVRSDFETLKTQPAALPATRLLATLIANQIVHIRIAIMEQANSLFHSKIGIFEDAEGKRVSFTGSTNETWRAWGANHECFDAFGSWQSESNFLRTREHADYFDRLWSGREPGVTVVDIDQLTRDELVEIADSDIDTAIAAVRTARPLRSPEPTKRVLMKHQTQVLEDWENNEYSGIVNFATGAGKTLTAIEAIRRWSLKGGNSVVVVPTRELHEQWGRELRREIPDIDILTAGAGTPKNLWTSLLRSHTSPMREGGVRVVLVTLKTFSSPDFTKRLNQGNHLLVVADEVHRVGSQRSISSLETVNVGARLGLTATLHRNFDPEGTDRLLTYFGRILFPSIGLAEALMLGLLVPYDYRLHEATLESDEVSKFNNLSDQIRRVSRYQSESSEGKARLTRLLIQRSRILKQARRKVDIAVSILGEEYREGDRWLVYCDDIVQLESIVAQCQVMRLPVMRFYAGMLGDRQATLTALERRGGIVVAIRCLDEGVDLPIVDHALILASSTAEREYIQRRGRVLRRSPSTGKVSAEIHDLVLVNSGGGALVRSEAVRALEFVRLARNTAARERLKAMVTLSDDPIDLPEMEDPLSYEEG